MLITWLFIDWIWRETWWIVKVLLFSDSCRMRWLNIFFKYSEKKFVSKFYQYFLPVNWSNSFFFLSSYHRLRQIKLMDFLKIDTTQIFLSVTHSTICGTKNFLSWIKLVIQPRIVIVKEVDCQPISKSLWCSELTIV